VNRDQVWISSKWSFWKILSLAYVPDGGTLVRQDGQSRYLRWGQTSWDSPSPATKPEDFLLLTEPIVSSVENGLQVAKEQCMMSIGECWVGRDGHHQPECDCCPQRRSVWNNFWWVLLLARFVVGRAWLVSALQYTG
jgi:hypothetical protein